MKTLITKLNGTVNNDDLLAIGQIKLNVSKRASQTAENSYSTIKFEGDKNLHARIVGNGFFTTENFSENKGTSLEVYPNVVNAFYVSNTDCAIILEDKYNLTLLNTPNSFELDVLRYSKKLTELSGTNVSGDISNLKSLTALTKLKISGTNVIGDIATINNLTNLTLLSLSGTNVIGDIASLNSLTALTGLNISKTNISGDIANIYFALSGTTKEFSVASCNNLSGNLASLPNNILFFDSYQGNSKFTWTRGSSRTNILACSNLHCANIDDMLNDMANMTASFAGQEAYYKTIDLIGTRTSASDAAVQTLQSKGYTVSITPA